MSKPLVVVASEREGLGLVRAWGLSLSDEIQLSAGNHEAALGLYRGQSHDVLISGVLEHHMVAATAAAVYAVSPAFIVNFGACGTYGARFGAISAPRINDVVRVCVSSRFDVGDNLHWVPPRSLNLIEMDLPVAHCVSGSR